MGGLSHFEFRKLISFMFHLVQRCRVINKQLLNKILKEWIFINYLKVISNFGMTLLSYNKLKPMTILNEAWSLVKQPFFNINIDNITCFKNVCCKLLCVPDEKWRNVWIQKCLVFNVQSTGYPASCGQPLEIWKKM